MADLTWGAYEALVLMNHNMLSMQEAVLATLANAEAPIKREELIERVHRLTSVDRVELSQNISGVLSRLEKEGCVTRPKYGYWTAI